MFYEDFEPAKKRLFVKKREEPSACFGTQWGNFKG